MIEVVTYYEFLTGGQFNDSIIQEISLAADIVIRKFHLQNPDGTQLHFSSEKGPNWYDGHIPYLHLRTVLEEGVVRYSHLYSYGTSKCKVIFDLINRPILVLEDLKCPSPRDFTSRYNCDLSCHKFPSVSWARVNAHSLYDCLLIISEQNRMLSAPKVWHILPLCLFQRYKSICGQVPMSKSTSQVRQGNDLFLNPKEAKPNLYAWLPNLTFATSSSRRPSVRLLTLLG